MAIEKFTQAEFEAALPKVSWRCAGLDERTGQLLYDVMPFHNGPFAIRVWSSIKPEGASSAEAGDDSIRAIITNQGEPWGGKPIRWIDRRPKWQTRLMVYLRRLANQIRWLRLPCPHCQSVLVSFMDKGRKHPENKGRLFVKCTNEKCKRFFEYVESNELDKDGNRVMIAPGNRPTAQTPATDKAPQVQSADAPKCPKCDSVMVRMGSGKGWRCGVEGNKYLGERQWSKCDGIVWDNANKQNPQATPAPVQPTATPKASTPRRPEGQIQFPTVNYEAGKVINGAKELLKRCEIGDVAQALRLLEMIQVK